MKQLIPSLLVAVILAGISTSCSRSAESANESVEATGEETLSKVVKRREDGTISSINQVNALGRVHGTRVTYFPDGKTVYSKLSFNEGVKQGPSIR